MSATGACTALSTSCFSSGTRGRPCFSKKQGVIAGREGSGTEDVHHILVPVCSEAVPLAPCPSTLVIFPFPAQGILEQSRNRKETLPALRGREQGWAPCPCCSPGGWERCSGLTDPWQVAWGGGSSSRSPPCCGLLKAAPVARGRCLAPAARWNSPMGYRREVP